MNRYAIAFKMPLATLSHHPLKLPTTNLMEALNPKIKAEALTSIPEACKNKGFFIIIRHGIPTTLQGDMLEQAKHFFDLPFEHKLNVDESYPVEVISDVKEMR